MSTSWPNNEGELTKWVRIYQIDEYELTKIEYELLSDLSTRYK